MNNACPACGRRAISPPYDIGDGPEYACSDCEWCWGAEGQPLTMDPVDKMLKAVRQAR